MVVKMIIENGAEVNAVQYLNDIATMMAIGYGIQKNMNSLHRRETLKKIAPLFFRVRQTCRAVYSEWSQC